RALEQQRAPLRLLRDDVEARLERRGQRRWRRRGENEGTRALNQVLDRPRGPGDERAGDAERLPRRVHGEKHAIADAMLFDQAGPSRAVYAYGMRFVDDQMRAGCGADLRILAQRRLVSVHGEQRFDDDEPFPTRLTRPTRPTP